MGSRKVPAARHDSERKSLLGQSEMFSAWDELRDFFMTVSLPTVSSVESVPGFRKLIYLTNYRFNSEPSPPRLSTDYATNAEAISKNAQEHCPQEAGILPLLLRLNPFARIRHAD